MRERSFVRSVRFALAVTWTAAAGWGLMTPCFAAPEDPTYTDPADVPADYAVQGEYLGEGTVEGRPISLAAQVIALGNGKFDVVGYLGGLPGDGWSRGDTSVKASGELKDGKVVLRSKEGPLGTLTGDTITVKTEDGSVAGALKKVVRSSPTLGQAPPEGAVVLFDGKDASAFVGGKMTDDGLLIADTITKEKFGDFTLHCEFRTPFKPLARGQARGNSGVYLQGRYEVQVLDSFGLEGRDNECGGIYQISAPKVNACLPPLVWQTYDIDFTAAKYGDDGKKTAPARVTIKHNGIVIHDDLTLPKHTPGKFEEANSDGPIYLQGHGNPVVFRNIWIVPR